ncbi:sigma-54-dependent transcriptional regulator [Desulfovermiculus halophilus]|uniref:sigma-54-dependent transcriptional regulator n=1 Tax=Desulfovermiculus halophilus TaxID=339722 RepID=UPI00048690D2|nr:sigma-54 dependent transcriptional regulator [Desulfovermiculus halophilus]
MARASILIVDDELILRESLSAWLARDDFKVEAVASAEKALERIRQTRYDIIFLDIKLEGMSGLEGLKKIRDLDQDTAVVMITAYGSISTAVEAMKDGAHDYLLKPFEPETLTVLIEKILERRARDRENLYLRAAHQERTKFENLIGQSPAMQEVFDLIQEVAPTDSTVLITGETGTGKELVAKAVHTRSSRAQGPFVAVNCGALPEHLMESEIFGHQKGAFTDAKSTKKGRLELAFGGSLFLDEVGEISVRMQIDLLRVLEERKFYRVGGTQPIEADFRVIAATNKDLEQAVRDGSFRQDLYYRLKVISIQIPPLRKRKEDIPLLADHFRLRFAQETNKEIGSISREALDEMMLYDWPGNIRELENAIERAVVVGKSRSIQPQDLPIFSSAQSRGPQDLSLREMEKEHIASILEQTNWNIKKSAEILGIDRSTLYHKLKRYGLSKT